AVHSTCLQLSTDPPQNEAQCRELAKLDDPARQLEAWQRATDTAPAGKVTAKHVANIVRSMLVPTGADTDTTTESYDYLAEAGRMLRTIRETVDRCPEDQREA